VSVFLARHWGGMVGKDIREPFPTITTTGSQDQIVCAFLQKYYGQGIGQSLEDPAHTIRTKDTLGLVTVTIQGDPYIIVDIAMRMLTPAELYRAQGFPEDYEIERGTPLTQSEQLGLLDLAGANGEPLTKTEQLRMVGNSVSPQVATALVRANAPALASETQSRWASAA